jgi:hypothetical protein
MRKILKMRNRFLTSLALVAVLAAACAPGTSTVAPPQPDVVEPAATVSADTAVPPADVPTEAAAATALPVATSRGPDLHATDPATVSLASGQLHFVEFFRFT